MKRHTGIRWIVAAMGILALAPGLIWAERSVPTAPQDGIYYYGAVDMQAKGENYDFGPIDGPPRINDTGQQRLGDSVSSASAGAIDQGGKVGGSGLSSTGNGGISKSDVVESNLRRMAKRLR